MNTRARRKNVIAEINITPFTDVILVLLIIFMITTPLIIQSSIKVKSPVAKSAKPIKKNVKPANITITEDNLIYLDDDLVTKGELRQKVAAMYTSNPDVEVVLLADKSIRFKDIVTVLDILNDIGVRNLNVGAKTES